MKRDTLTRQHSLEQLKKKINARFPSALVSARNLASVLPDSAIDFSANSDSIYNDESADKLAGLSQNGLFRRLAQWPLPRSRSLAVSGPGTTSMMWWLMAQTMADFNEAVAYVDGTGSFFPPGASLAGVDLQFLFWMNPENASCAVRAAELLTASNLFGLVILDAPRGHVGRAACRRLHLSLLHSDSRLVLAGETANILPITVHKKIRLNLSQLRSEVVCASSVYGY